MTRTPPTETTRYLLQERASLDGRVVDSLAELQRRLVDAVVRGDPWRPTRLYGHRRRWRGRRPRR